MGYRYCSAFLRCGYVGVGGKVGGNNTSNNHFISFISFDMRKVLAVASVGTEHKELVLKDLKSIFRRIKIPLDILLQEEYAEAEKGTPSSSGTLLKAYPYITLTIPNYEQHRECTSL